MQIETPSSTPPSLSTRLAVPGGEEQMKFWGRAICFAAVIMIAPPMLGLIGTFIDIHQSMGSGGIADTKVLADHISRVLLYTLGSMVIAVIGLVLLIISTCRFFSCRAKCRPPAP